MGKLLNIQVYSDYHIEWWYPNEPFERKIPPPNGSGVLVLAGDICSAGSAADKYVGALRRFLSYVSKHYLLVIYVPGNHEYYNFSKKKIDWLTISEVDARLRQLCSEFENVRYLSNSSVKFTTICDGEKVVYRFIGTTLWGMIPDPLHFDIESHKNDFYQISARKGHSITVPELNQHHRTALKFLENAIQNANKMGEKIIIITHHQPYITKKDFCFHDMSMDTMNLIKPPVKLWIMGHMHHHRDLKINTVRIVENAVGYPKERTNYISNQWIRV